MKDWVLRFKRARLLARDRLCLLEAIMSVMNFLQSTQTSMVFQSSISSFGRSISSWDEDDWRVCLDNLRKTGEQRVNKNIRAVEMCPVLGCRTWTLCAAGWVDGGSCWASLACGRTSPVSKWTWTDPESKWGDCHKALMAGASKATEKDCYVQKIKWTPFPGEQNEPNTMRFALEMESRWTLQK